MLKNNQRNTTEVPTSNPGKGKRKSRVIVLNALLCLFSLSGIISGTTAWFSSNKTVEVTGSSFTVTTPDDLDFDLYYLESFTVDTVVKNGNYNPGIMKFAGYETSYDASYATFTQVEYDEDDLVVEDNEKGNPTNITKLWPAHRLTYAIVTSESVSSFSLTDWSEETSENSKTGASSYVSISWAINMYGAAYSIEATGTVTDDIQAAFASYEAETSLEDKFTYSEADPAPDTVETITIVDSIPNQVDDYLTVLFFTLEFSNDSDTYYSYDEDTGYYTKSTSGNSNCYENLLINGLVFNLA